MRHMLFCFEIGNEDHAHAHGILPVLGHIHWGLEVVLYFQLVGLGGYYLDDRHLGHQLLWLLPDQAPGLDVPTCSFEVQALNITAVLWFLFDGVRISSFGDHRVQG